MRDRDFREYGIFSQIRIRRRRESSLSVLLACNSYVETNGPESLSASFLVPTNAILMSLEVFHFTSVSCRCSWTKLVQLSVGYS